MARRQPSAPSRQLGLDAAPRAAASSAVTPPTPRQRTRVVDLLAAGFLSEIEGRAIEFYDGSALRQIRRTNDDDEWEERWHGHGDGTICGDAGPRWGNWETMGWHNGERIGPSLCYPDLFHPALGLAGDEIVEDTLWNGWDDEIDGDPDAETPRDNVEARWPELAATPEVTS